MSDIGRAHDVLVEGVESLRAVSGEERITALGVGESLTRRLEQVSVELVAALVRDGVFIERGYSRPASAVADLLGCDVVVAARRVKVAAQVCARVGLDGGVLPPLLPATAAVFAAGQISLRHVEVLVDALNSAVAGRLAPEVWAGAEEQLAAQAALYPPAALSGLARDLLALLDQDGPEPRDEPDQVNELRLVREPAGGGGRVRGRLDATTFGSLATALDALSTPSPEDDRPLPQRQADALGEVCRQALDRGELPSTGGERPHLNVVIPLAELERRARTGLLDVGGQLTPARLRMLACDARVVPVVLGGDGQPVDVGRARRTVPAHIRRAVIVRDRGCAFGGCARPPSWCDIHHVVAWEHGGTTEIGNLVALCRTHHRLLHHSEWHARIRDGHPEFVPPKWVDFHQAPRCQPRPVPVA